MFVPRDEIKAAHDLFMTETAEAVEKGEHYFITVVGYKVDVTTLGGFGPIALDADSLRVVPSLGCFICEEPYQKGMDMHCKGEP
jgi:hypothetical protein